MDEAVKKNNKKLLTVRSDKFCIHSAGNLQYVFLCLCNAHTMNQALKCATYAIASRCNIHTNKTKYRVKAGSQFDAQALHRVKPSSQCEHCIDVGTQTVRCVHCEDNFVRTHCKECFFNHHRCNRRIKPNRESGLMYLIILLQQNIVHGLQSCISIAFACWFVF